MMSDLWPSGPLPGLPHDYGDDGRALGCRRCGLPHFLDATGPCRPLALSDDDSEAEADAAQLRAGFAGWPDDPA